MVLVEILQEHRRVDDENGGGWIVVWYEAPLLFKPNFGFTTPSLAYLPIIGYAGGIKVGRASPPDLSLPAFSARPLPGRCSLRSPQGTDPTSSPRSGQDIGRLPPLTRAE